MTDSSKDIPAKAEKTPSSEDPEMLSAVQKLAEKKPEAYELMISMMGSMGHPLHHKLTPEHITKSLQIAGDHDERQFTLLKQEQDQEHAYRSTNRLFFVVALILFFIFFGFLCVLFKDQPNILIPLLTGLGGFVTGFAGGFGMGGRRKKEE